MYWCVGMGVGEYWCVAMGVVGEVFPDYMQSIFTPVISHTHKHKMFNFFNSRLFSQI